jgi:hypothetical protein
MLAKQALYPAINLPAIYAFKLDPHAGLDERANRFQTQIFCFVIADYLTSSMLVFKGYLVPEKSRNCHFPSNRRYCLRLSRCPFSISANMNNWKQEKFGKLLKILALSSRG